MSNTTQKIKKYLLLSERFDVVGDNNLYQFIVTTTRKQLQSKQFHSISAIKYTLKMFFVQLTISYYQSNNQVKDDYKLYCQNRQKLFSIPTISSL